MDYLRSIYCMQFPIQLASAPLDGIASFGVDDELVFGMFSLAKTQTAGGPPCVSCMARAWDAAKTILDRYNGVHMWD